LSDIFVSYARSNEAHSQRIGEALRALGYRVWRDDQLPAHRSYAQVIEERLKAAKAVVVIWSAEAVKSEWVQSEADRARADRKLVQLTVDGAPLPMPFDRIQCADLSGWNGEAEAPGWRKVVESIAELAGHGEAAQSGAAARSEPPRPRVGICVLPFANMSGEPEQEYFSDGITEDIITDLSKVSALSVASRNTAFTFKGKHVSVAEVAGQLGVSHVLEGSVRKAGNRVRITAQLIEGSSDSHIWAERYDRDLDDIFALQDEISQAIVAALKLKLAPDEKKAIERRATTNPEAYNLYLMARRQFIIGNVGDPRREEAIVRLCQRAVELDPGYAQAWAYMAFAQSTLVHHRGQTGDDGDAATERALELDPSLALPHAVRAQTLTLVGKAADAEREIETALRLDPESYEVNRLAGSVYFRLRRPDDSIRHFERAAALDETDFSSSGMCSSLYRARRDRENVRRLAQMTLQRAQNVLLNDPHNGHAMAYGAMALADLGEQDRAKEWMARAMLVDPDNLTMRYNFACLLVTALGDLDGAIDLLGPVFALSPSARISHAKIDPDFEPLRGDPRFQAMIAEAEARQAKAGEAQAAG
jgi:adenylate cyclase